MLGSNTRMSHVESNSAGDVNAVIGLFARPSLRTTDVHQGRHEPSVRAT